VRVSAERDGRAERRAAQLELRGHQSLRPCADCSAPRRGLGADPESAEAPNAFI